MRVKLFIHSCVLGGCLYIGLVKHLAPFVDERKLCDSHMEVAPSTLNATALHLHQGQCTPWCALRFWSPTALTSRLLTANQPSPSQFPCEVSSHVEWLKVIGKNTV